MTTGRIPFTISVAIRLRVSENIDYGMDLEQAHRTATIETEAWWTKEKRRRAVREALRREANMRRVRKLRVY